MTYFKTYENTVKNIYNYYKEIECLNLSNIEKIMYAYDIVRNRVYNMESENESLNVSRDLSNVLLGDKIVCVGYSKMFKVLLEMLGIDVQEVFIEGKINHERTLIYVKDDKYGIDGAYYFDATWDSKRKEGDNRYLYSYKHFAKTKKYFEEIESGKESYDTKIHKFNPYLADNFKNIVSIKGIEFVPKSMLDEINFMSKTVNGKNLITFLNLNRMMPFYEALDLDKTVEEIKRLTELFNKEIDAETFIKVLYNVRKLRYYKDQTSCPFDIDSFYKTAIISKWKFSKTCGNSLLYEILLGKKYEPTYKNQMLDYVRENDMFREIKRVELTKTLSLIDKKNHTL